MVNLTSHELIITSEIKGSEALPKIFCMLVQIGNFLNANAVFGNAAGFRLNSLWKILDMKAAKKSITLLHFISMVRLALILGNILYNCMKSDLKDGSV